LRVVALEGIWEGETVGRVKKYNTHVVINTFQGDSVRPNK
jgi:hypothetical protein